MIMGKYAYTYIWSQTRLIIDIPLLHPLLRQTRRSPLSQAFYLFLKGAPKQPLLVQQAFVQLQISSSRCVTNGTLTSSR